MTKTILTSTLVAFLSLGGADAARGQPENSPMVETPSVQPAVAIRADSDDRDSVRRNSIVFRSNGMDQRGVEFLTLLVMLRSQNTSEKPK